jgi:hypothetical protein
MSQLTTVLAALTDAPEKFSRWPDLSGRGWTAALLLLMLLALVALGLYIVNKFLDLLRNPRADLALFDELSDAHGLSRSERRALISFARREKLDDPSRLFTEPELLESSDDPVLKSLAERLFGE